MANQVGMKNGKIIREYYASGHILAYLLHVVTFFIPMIFFLKLPLSLS